jgi:hypothetical protein
MHYIYAAIACVLLLLAVLSFEPPAAVGTAAMFLAGSVLAALAYKRWLPLWAVRMLAVVSAAALFGYFGQFFSMVPTLAYDWYAGSEAARVIGLLFAGFAMIPVLSEYSCRMKATADCALGRRQPETRKSPILDFLKASS